MHDGSKIHWYGAWEDLNKIVKIFEKIVNRNENNKDLMKSTCIQCFVNVICIWVNSTIIKQSNLFLEK